MLRINHMDKVTQQNHGAAIKVSQQNGINEAFLLLQQMMGRRHIIELPNEAGHQRFEDDIGLMNGDDGGYSDYAQLCLEEDALRNIPTGVYKLLGDSPSNSLGNRDDSQSPFDYRLQKCSIGILASDIQSLPRPVLQDQQQQQQTQPKQEPTDETYLRQEENLENIFQLIGQQNTVVRSVRTLTKIREMREFALKTLTQGMPSTPRKAEQSPVPVKEEPSLYANSSSLATPAKSEATNSSTQLQASGKNRVHEKKGYNDKKRIRSRDKQDEDFGIYEITTEVPFNHRNRITNYSTYTRERSIAHSICALLFTHAGFLDASARALNIMTDVLEYFVLNLGRNLQTSFAEESSVNDLPAVELARVIGNSGFRGGFADLVFYMKSEPFMKEACYREVYVKLRNQLTASPIFMNGKTLNLGFDATSIKAGSTKTESAESEHTSTGDQAVKLDVRLGDDAFSFGFISPKVRLDVLNGIKVPSRLAYNSRKRLSSDKKGFDMQSAKRQNSGNTADIKMESKNVAGSSISPVATSRESKGKMS